MADEPKDVARRYAPDALADWTARIFASAGVAKDVALPIARTMVRTDLRGYRTHGMTRVASYVQRYTEGDFNPRPDIRLTVQDGVIIVDSDGALGHAVAPVLHTAAMAELAKRPQVFVAVRECGHLGALGIHALAAAEAGAFCMLGQRTPPLLAMEGFTEPGLGHNPIAFGCPLPGREPIVFDIACSVAARGHSWAVDRHGKPTTDSREAVHGMLMPMGGHKGIGIAMMVECLAGAFTATAESLGNFVARVPAGGAVGRQSAFFWYMDPGAFSGRAVFDAYMSKWTEVYEDAGGRLPGSRGEILEAEGRALGLAVAPDIERELRALGERTGVPFDLTAAA